MYDVTKYQHDHPGGAEVLIEAAGTDASEDFDNAGHSEDATDIMTGYHVGSLKGYKKPTPKPPSPPKQTSPSQGKKKKPLNTYIMSQLASLGTISLAAASYYVIGQHLNITLPNPIRSVLRSMRSPHSSLGFLPGILLGAGSLVVIDAAIMQRAIQGLKVSKTFASYPAHIKVPQPTPENVLLKRGWLDPANYSELPLVKKTMVGPNVYRLEFQLPSEDSIIGLPTGQHITIKAKVEAESISRSYTPISNNRDKGVLQLIIKVYPDGKLTQNYIANLQVGDEVSFRGPKGAMRYSPGMCKKIGMIAGGTGITPLFQLIRAICEDDRDTTEISLLYANRGEDDIILRKELDTFARRYPKIFKVFYVLNHAPAGWKFGSGHISKEMIEDKLPGPSHGNKMLLCGPPGMVMGVKESLGSLGFQLPGASSKMTDQVFVF